MTSPKCSTGRASPSAPATTARSPPCAGSGPRRRSAEVALSLDFDGGDTIADVKFRGRGCAISQAATSMLTELVKGRTAAEVAAMPKEELLGEGGVPPPP